MRKIELLAPAGDKECFLAAVHCGADAIYIGGVAFSARAFAKNFNDEDMKWAVTYAHIYGVRVYVTVNTLYKDHEMAALLKYIDFLYQIQIDALITQDLGLFLYIRQAYPDFELHMSTQASIINQQSAQYFEKLGAKRIVLARENTIAEVQEIVRHTNVEIEVFVHGALCVCYSGQCLMSSMIGKRSGNRGECAQPCRLKYRLMQDDVLLDDRYPYLLSPRDLNTIDHVNELIESGIHSLKIEGRMKKPEYVAATVIAYRHAIDAYYNHERISLEDEKQDMLAMFNRQYTCGYLFHDKHIVDGDYSGNKGILIGKVISYNKKLKRVQIRLSDDISQGDSIVFEKIDKGRPINKIFKNGRLVNRAFKNDIIEIEFDYYINEGNVRKTVDTLVVKKMQQIYKKPHNKQKIEMLFKAHINQKATLTISLNDICVTTQSSIVEHAIKTPTDKQRIKEQLAKVGQTPFDIKQIEIEMDDDISIPIKEINALRRQACEELESILAHQKIHDMKKQSIDYPISKPSLKSQLYVHVSNLEQLNIVKKYPDISIIYPFQEDAIEAYNIYPKMILATSQILKTKEIEEIKNSRIYSLVDCLLVNNYGAYAAFSDKDLIVGTGMNIYNSKSAMHYPNMKIISPELSLTDINQMHIDYNKSVIQVYGKIENMVSEYCPISYYNFGYLKKNCQICRKHSFSIIDRKGAKFDILTDQYCRMHLLHYQTLFLEDEKFPKIKNRYLHFTNEKPEEVTLMMNYFSHKNNDLSQIKEHFLLTNGYY